MDAEWLLNWYWYSIGIQIYSRWLFYRTNWMPNMIIMAQGLNSTGTNNLTRLVAQCAFVL